MCTYLYLPEKLHFPVFGDKAGYRTMTMWPDTTNTSTTVNVVGHKVREIVVHYMAGLQKIIIINPLIYNVNCVPIHLFKSFSNL